MSKVVHLDAPKSRE